MNKVSEEERAKFADMLWSNVPFVVFDLETTGFGAAHKIIEFGATVMRGNRPAEKMHHLINPGMPIPAAAMAVHKITDAMVASKPVWRDVARECFDFLFQGYPIVAHNLMFDAGMLSRQVDPRRWPRDIFTLCTMELARKNGHKGKAKLSMLAEHYNLEYETEHAAMDDSIVTGMLARRLAGSQPVSKSATKTTGDWADYFLSK